jgi:hypothetical protein
MFISDTIAVYLTRIDLTAVHLGLVILLGGFFPFRCFSFRSLALFHSLSLLGLGSSAAFFEFFSQPLDSLNLGSILIGRSAHWL